MVTGDKDFIYFLKTISKDIHPHIILQEKSTNFEVLKMVNSFEPLRSSHVRPEKGKYWIEITGSQN